MLIEFDINTTIEHDARQYVIAMLQISIHNWAQCYQVNTRQKIVKSKLRLCFDRDELYSFFLMTFDHSDYHSDLVKMSLIQDLNNR